MFVEEFKLVLSNFGCLRFDECVWLYGFGVCMKLVYLDKLFV